MARKSLSAQILEELGRLEDMLTPIKALTDPMTAHMIDVALESVLRVENLCKQAQQRDYNVVLTESPLATAFGATQEPPAPARKRSAAHGSPRRSKSDPK